MIPDASSSNFQFSVYRERDFPEFAADDDVSVKITIS